MKIWCVVNSENLFQKLVGQCHQTWTCAVQLRRGAEILKRSYLRQGLFFCNAIPFCILWLFFRCGVLPWSLASLSLSWYFSTTWYCDSELQSIYTTVEPHIIGRSPFDIKSVPTALSIDPRVNGIVCTADSTYQVASKAGMCQQKWRHIAGKSKNENREQIAKE